MCINVINVVYYYIDIKVFPVRCFFITASGLENTLFKHVAYFAVDIANGKVKECKMMPDGGDNDNQKGTTDCELVREQKKVSLSNIFLTGLLYISDKLVTFFALAWL